MNKDKLVKRHVFDFSPGTNGGESLTLTTDFYDNGDKDAYMNQEFSLQSYCNSASFQLVGTPLTPGLLRKLANELESAEIEARAELKKKMV